MAVILLREAALVFLTRTSGAIMSAFAENAPVQTVNPSLVIKSNGLELLPLSRDGKAYPSPYKTSALRLKLEQLGILPAGVRFTVVQSDDGRTVVSDGKDDLVTPDWNLCPFEEQSGTLDLRAAAEAGDIPKLTQAVTAGADYKGEMKGLLMLAIRKLEKGSPHAAFIRHLLTSPDLPDHPSVHLDDDGALRRACEVGDLALAKWLTSSPKLAERVDMAYRLDWAYSIAYHAKQDAILQWLTTDHKALEDGNVLDFRARQAERAVTEAAEAGDLVALTAAARATPAEFKACLPAVFRDTARRLAPEAPGQAAVIRHLLSCRELPARADVHANHELAFIRACAAGEAELVRWLATSPELAERADPYACGFAGFGAALIAGHDEVLRVLIHELDAMNHIPVNSDMESEVRSACGTGIADHPKVIAILAEKKR